MRVGAAELTLSLRGLQELRQALRQAPGPAS